MPVHSDCYHLNPLQRDGVSQRQRLVRALHPNYVLVDEREVQDYLLYAREYATLLRYYSTHNDPDGDWRIFIEKDITTLAAIIAHTDLKEDKKEFEAAITALRALPLAQRWAQLHQLFDLAFALAKRANRWLSQSIEGLQLNGEMRRVIGAVLTDALREFRNYAARANELPTITAAHPITIPAASQFEPRWNLSAPQADPSVFPSGDPPTEEELEQLIGRLKKAFKKLHDGLRSVVEKGDELIGETLENYPRHRPHMALYLAFLCVFKIARDHLNTLTRRHLNFYFREVLRLQPRPAQPDEVHLIFEMAKNFEVHRVEKGTILKGGKDDKGANILFKTDEELLVNKTKIAENGLRSLFMDKSYDENGQYLSLHNIHAAPIANSADGLGADIETEDGKWLPFGDAHRPDARIGFAIASPLFLLKEGTRTLTLSFTVEKETSLDWGAGNSTNNPLAHELRHNLKVFYSGEKAWVPVGITKAEIDLGAGETGKIILTIELDAGAEAFVGYDDEILQDGFKTPHPVLKIILDNDGLSANYLCFDLLDAEPNTPQALVDLIPPFILGQILQVLNAAQKWEDIAGMNIDLTTAPTQESLDAGMGKIEPNPDLDQATAEKILGIRALIGGKYTTLDELFGIPELALSLAQLKNLVFTFCLNNAETYSIGQVKAIARPFDPNLQYYQNALVTHEDQWYKALMPVKGAYPSPQSRKWQWLAKSYPYQYFQQLDLMALELHVDVDKVKGLILENDIGSLNPAKPFQPFGPLPKVGSKFYIGNHEVFQKKIDALILRPVWADLPQGQSFVEYYKNYHAGGKPSNDNVFKIAMETLTQGGWQPIKDGPNAKEFALFNDNAVSNVSPVAKESFELSGLLTSRKTQLPEFTTLEPTATRGFIRWNLLRDFSHRYYAASLADAVAPGSPSAIPNEPYTPTLASFELDYESSETIPYHKLFKSDYEGRVEQLFHIEPFGWKEFFPVPNAGSDENVFVSRKLVPQFKVSLTDQEGTGSSQTDAEGTLYIGLQELEPPQILTLLIQVAEGSADPELDTQPVVWSYLSNNRWMDFETTALLSDTTNGLLTSGILRLVMPKAITSTNTRLPANTYWIKASVAAHTPALSKTIAILPQAVKATFQIDSDNDLERLSKALKASTVTKLQTRLAAIKSVDQPFSSFGGKVAERVEAPKGVSDKDLLNKEYNEFYIRISERLRHKNRGITIWDYERLVLQQFPEIYKVKCINHTRLAQPGLCAPEHAPGHVKVIVLPNLRNQNAVDPLKPMVSKNQLERIKSFLGDHTSDFVRLEVRNPAFERIRVEFKVRFLPQFNDKGFYTDQLQQDLVRFLSPWLYDEGEDLVVGGTVHRSSIINFIEETRYVDFLTDFKMHQLIPQSDGTERILQDVEEARASTSSSVLVSVPAAEHLIGHDIYIKCLDENP